jgi:hypothetical protein
MPSPEAPIPILNKIDFIAPGTLDSTDGAIERRERDYLQRVMDLLGFDEKAQTQYLKLEYQPLEPITSGRTGVPIEGNIILLKARGKLIASIIEFLDEFSYRQVATTCYLTPQLIKQLRRGIAPRYRR